MLHHFVAERFFGRSSNRRGEIRERLFETCPWNCEGRSAVYCYECHEELLHNPVFTPLDMKRFAQLVRARGLSEETKSPARSKLAGRVTLLHEVIAAGLSALLDESERPRASAGVGRAAFLLRLASRNGVKAGDTQ